MLIQPVGHMFADFGIVIIKTMFGTFDLHELAGGAEHGDEVVAIPGEYGHHRQGKS